MEHEDERRERNIDVYIEVKITTEYFYGRQQNVLREVLKTLIVHCILKVA
jgi:hypothetical protein